MIDAKVIVDDRIRNIRQCTFGWIDHNLLHHGLVKQLAPESLLLYFFLCLVADRQGLSYYDYEKICSLLKIDLEQYLGARGQLMAQSLIAFEQPVFQVLSLPNRDHHQPLVKRQQPREAEPGIKSLKQVFEQLYHQC